MKNCEDNNRKMPKHIGFIMDGNGRWAQLRGLPRQQGHIKGVQTVEKVVDYIYTNKIRCATLYTFSTENWSRPKAEIDMIFSLFSSYLDKLYNKYLTDKEAYSHIEFRFIGNISAFSDEIVSKIHRIEELLKHQSDIYTTINIAVNYGGRDEIVTAVNDFIRSNPGKEISLDDISSRIYTHSLPDPDLIVRTAGEYRLSNFLTWQSVYSEYYATDVLWPDFTEKDIEMAIEYYSNRKRKFGSVVTE